MFGGDRDLDTICAISTPPGVGGIHLVRISGSSSLKIVRQFAPFLPDKMESHRVYYGTVVSTLFNNEPVDEVLLSYFRSGHSYTGEETVEISCHGSPFIAQQIIKLATFYGSRIADRGEFTYRSFLNGKLDLIQAESVLSLIQSESAQSLKVALNQLKGGLSSKLKKIESEIISLLARLEVSIDFTTEDIEIISHSEIFDRLNSIKNSISILVQSFQSGQKIQSGYEVILVGEPNVGKSSLLNRLLFEERAIVTDIPGTTRDLIQEQIVIKGVKVTLIDSAGIRETNDIIEQIGVSKTSKAIEKADLILVVFDVTNPSLGQILEKLPTDLNRILLIGNKIDLISDSQIGILKDDLQNLLIKLNKFQNRSDAETFIKKRSTFVSAKDEAKFSKIQEQIISLIELNLDTGSFGDEAIIVQMRHFENLSRASECLLRAELLIQNSYSPEFLALEVKESLIRVQEILGERYDDQILDKVFSEFCIGK